jgi:hypothetical protein
LHALLPLGTRVTLVFAAHERRTKPCTAGTPPLRAWLVMARSGNLETYICWLHRWRLSAHAILRSVVAQSLFHNAELLLVYTAAGASLHVRSLSCCCVLPARCRGQCVLALQRGLCIRYLLNRSAPGETTAFQPPHPFHARTGLPLARLHVVAPTYACPHIVHLVPPALPHCSGRSNGRVPTLTARWGRLFSR